MAAESGRRTASPCSVGRIAKRIAVPSVPRPRLFGFLARLSRRRDVAEDLLEETCMQVLRLGDAFALLGASGIGEAAYATPAIVGDRIYIRGLTHLFRIAAARP